MEAGRQLRNLIASLAWTFGTCAYDFLIVSCMLAAMGNGQKKGKRFNDDDDDYAVLVFTALYF